MGLKVFQEEKTVCTEDQRKDKPTHSESRKELIGSGFLEHKKERQKHEASKG